MKNLSEKKLDDLLNIKTRGTRESKTKQHYRYEATPYSDLLLLFEKITLKPTDHLLDFGSGKGRVCFYSHHLFNCFADGIEANLSTYHEALLNLNDYSLKQETNNKIAFHYNYAEKFPINQKYNVFFFFNPFTVQIFKQVLANINSSLKEYRRKIIIILAFPIVEYVSYLLEHTNFIIYDYIEAGNKKDKQNKFLILTNE